MQVEIGELDESGGVWVTVSGNEQAGDYVKAARAKAAGAIRKYAAEHNLGKATRITAGGTMGEQWEYRVRYTFENAPQQVADEESGNPFEIRYDPETPDLSQRWQVWHKPKNLLCASAETEAECETYVSDALAPDAADWLDESSPLLTALAEVDTLPTVGPDERLVILGKTLDWANDEVAQLLAEADSRCQAQPIHRQRGVTAVAYIDINNRLVKACQQCTDYFLAGVKCQYRAAHNIRQIAAVTVIDAGRVGLVPACRECAEFYNRQDVR